MKTHIMLVDNDKDELIFFLDALKQVPYEDGFKCTYAGSAGQAIEMLKYLVPDFIFVDFKMPEINGLEFLSMIRMQPWFQKSKVYLYSMFSNEAIEKAAFDLGASGILTKKYKINMLSKELTSILTPDMAPAYAFSGGERFVNNF